MTAAAVIVFSAVLDRLLKHAALGDRSARSIIGDWFRFRFEENYYIAFSLPLTGSLLTAIILSLLCVVAYYAYRSMKSGDSVSFFLYAAIFSGGISNLYDRLAYGYVVDYLDLRYFTVFNLADVLITSGALSLVIVSLAANKKKTDP